MAWESTLVTITHRIYGTVVVRWVGDSYCVYNLIFCCSFSTPADSRRMCCGVVFTGASLYLHLSTQRIILQHASSIMLTIVWDEKWVANSFKFAITENHFQDGTGKLGLWVALISSWRVLLTDMVKLVVINYRFHMVKLVVINYRFHLVIALWVKTMWNAWAQLFHGCIWNGGAIICVYYVIASEHIGVGMCCKSEDTGIAS